MSCSSRGGGCKIRYWYILLYNLTWQNFIREQKFMHHGVYLQRAVKGNWYSSGIRIFRTLEKPIDSILQAL